MTHDLDELGFVATRRLSSGYWLAVEPQTFGRARLGISSCHEGARPTDAPTIEAILRTLKAQAFAVGYRDVWDYGSRDAAILAMKLWDGDGEPAGWIRHAGTGRRLDA